MNRTTVGLIGAGRIGRMHAENLVRAVPEAWVKMVADPGVDEDWARDLGIPHIVRETAELLADEEIEAVIIAAPSKRHVELIESAAAAGKHIFCEKPIAFDPEPIARAAAAAETARVKLQVGFNRRFDASFQRVRTAVQSGELGDLFTVRVVARDTAPPSLDFLRTSGGMFLDCTVHDFDTIRFISGSEIAEIYALGAVLVDSAIGTVGDIDTAVVTVRLANGALGIIDNSRQSNYGYDQKVEASGSRGAALAENTRPTSVVVSKEEGVFVDRPHYSFVERFHAAFVAELASFVSCVRDDLPVAVTARDAAEAVRAANAALISMREHRPVRVEEVSPSFLEEMPA